MKTAVIRFIMVVLIGLFMILPLLVGVILGVVLSPWYFFICLGLIITDPIGLIALMRMRVINII